MSKNVIILAAGVGSRLRPITDSIPKTMVQVAGKSILQRLLDQIGSLEKNFNVIIIAGYKAEAIIDFIKSGRYKANVLVNEKFSKTNNMFSLNMGLMKLKPNEDLVIINADCVYDDHIVSEMLSKKNSTIAVDKSQFNEESMKVRLDVSGNVKEMSKQLLDDLNTHVSIDIYHINKAHVDILKSIVSDILTTDVNQWTEVSLDLLSKKDGVQIEPWDIDNLKWMEIDNHQDLEIANNLFQS